MQKILVTLSAAATALVLAAPASAQDRYYPQNPAPYAAPIAGAAVGTTVGLGLYNGCLLYTSPSPRDS